MKNFWKGAPGGAGLTKAAPPLRLFFLAAFFCVFFGFFFLLSGCSKLPNFIFLKDPLSPEEHLVLGMAYEKDGELELAEREYGLAEPLPFATYALGNLAARNGDYEKAEARYREVIKKEPMPEALNNLAFLLLTQGERLEEAYSLASLAAEEAGRQDLSDAVIKNIRNTKNQAEIALARSRRAGAAGGP